MAQIAKTFMFLLLLGFLTAEELEKTTPEESDLEESESTSGFRFFNNPGRSSRIRFPTDSEESSEELGQDSFVVSAHYQVSHPPTYFGKNKEQNQLNFYPQNQKPISYSDFTYSNSKSYHSDENDSNEDDDDDNDNEFKESKPHYYNKKYLKKQQLFKPIIPEFQTDLEVSNIPIDDHQIHDLDVSQFKPNFELQNVPNLYPREQRKYLDVATKGQIEKFLEDQQRYFDEELEYQLLNDPNPSSKGLYQQFLKAKDDERIEKEYEENLKKKPEVLPSFKTNFENQFPVKIESRNLNKKPLGLGHYRTSEDSGAYSFELDL